MNGSNVATLAHGSTALAASHVKGGSFAVRGVDRSHLEQTFDREVKAVRVDVPPLPVEPKRSEIAVHGEGPSRYFTRR